MTQRSYNQYCPIAHALDLIGDRWTLLIIRDLLLGPKRFSDLAAGLPGLGTNLLTERLRQLEQAQLLQRRSLPPPAASNVYELTAYGRELKDVLAVLAQWGAQTLGSIQAGQVLSRDTVLLTVRALLRSWPADSPATSYRIRLIDERMPETLELRGAGINADFSPVQVGDTLVELTLDLATLFAIAGGKLAIQTAIRQGVLRVQVTPGKALE